MNIKFQFGDGGEKGSKNESLKRYYCPPPPLPLHPVYVHGLTPSATCVPLREDLGGKITYIPVELREWTFHSTPTTGERKGKGKTGRRKETADAAAWGKRDTQGALSGWSWPVTRILAIPGRATTRPIIVAAGNE